MRPRTSLHPPHQQIPDCSEERLLAAQGYYRVAGIDEAGRGSWAGPLVAAAVCLPFPEEQNLELLGRVRDSKQLSPKQRDALFQRILECAVDVGVGIVSPSTIDRLGLTLSSELAMLWAVEELSVKPDCLLIDAFRLRNCDLPQRPLIRGDSLSLSIASASIIAKVTRDRLMCFADRVFPGFGFINNKGYGTGLHKNALQTLGPCSYHRCSYEPVKRKWGLPL
ncbi:MAG: ribonuclease HII [Chloroflexota bacterium]|jgi:ribonuclease HII